MHMHVYSYVLTSHKKQKCLGWYIHSHMIHQQQFITCCFFVCDRLSEEDRANLQFTTDGEGGEGASYGAVFGEVVRGFADQLHQQVEEYTDSVVEEDPSQAIMSLQNELDGVFDVTEGQGYIHM